MNRMPSPEHRHRTPVAPSLGLIAAVRLHLPSLALLSGLVFFALSSTVAAQKHDQTHVDGEAVSARVDAALAAVSERIDAAVAQGRLTPEEGEEKRRQARADIIWKAALSMDPDQWPESLQTLILELRPGATIEQFAQWARDQRQKSAQGEREKRIWAAAMAQDPSEWSDRLKAALLELKPDSTLEAIAEGIRQRQRLGELRQQLRAAVEAGEITPEQAREKLQEARAGMGGDAQGESEDRLQQLTEKLRAAVAAGEITPEQARQKLREARGQMGERGDDRRASFRRGVLERAMAEDPDQWSQRLLDAIARAGWDADALADRIRAHRARGSDGETADRALAQLVEDLGLDTSVQARSWGGIKNDPRD